LHPLTYPPKLQTSTTLLWTLLSITSYTRRHLPYTLTLTTDLLLLTPLALLAALLGPPLATAARCTAVTEPKAQFSITTVLGSIALPGSDACVRAFAAWVLLLVACASLVVSVLAVGCLRLRERRGRREFWEIKGGGSEEGVGDGRGFAVAVGAGAGPKRGGGDWDVMRGGWEKPGLVSRAEEQVMHIPMAPERVGDSDDALLMNRPVTIARVRAGNGGTVPGGWGYGASGGQRSMGRVYQGSRRYRSSSVSRDEDVAGLAPRFRRADAVGLPGNPRGF
jgi:hypothetical protein